MLFKWSKCQRHDYCVLLLMSRNWNERRPSASARECIFKNQNSHVTMRFGANAEKNPFLRQKENALNIDEKYVFFVIARSCRMYALYFVMATVDRTLLQWRWIKRSAVCTILRCFRNAKRQLNGPLGSSGMQKNQIVFKISCKHHEMSKELISVSDIAKTHNTLMT